MKELVFVSLICAVLLFGCTGGSQPQGQQLAQGAPPAPGSGQKGGNASSAGEVPPPPPGNNGSQAAPAPEPKIEPKNTNSVDSLLGALRLSHGWKATYDLSGTGGVSGVMTQYMSSGGNFRMDAVSSGIESRTYVVGKGVTICAKQDASWNCYKFSGESLNSSTEVSATLGTDLEQNPSGYTVTADGSMQVAGTTAACYKVVDKDGTVRYCVSPEGVPLYVLTNSQSGGVSATYEMKATSYSTSVLDSDFALPAAPQDMGSIFPAGAAGSGGGSAGADTCSYCSYMSGDQKAQCLASCSG